jgi:hypothetical protein
MATWRASHQPAGNPKAFGYAFSGVYFVRVGSFVKIGFSDDVKARYRVLLSASPYDMKPLGFIHADGGAEELEERIHAQFAELRHRGEWFRFDGSIREFIADHAAGWPT